jgi:hypothetical protein
MEVSTDGIRCRRRISVSGADLEIHGNGIRSLVMKWGMARRMHVDKGFLVLLVEGYDTGNDGYDWSIRTSPAENYPKSPLPDGVSRMITPRGTVTSDYINRLATSLLANSQSFSALLTVLYITFYHDPSVR